MTTANRRGAGTRSTIRVALTDVHNVTTPLVLLPTTKFKRSSVVTCEIDFPDDSGRSTLSDLASLRIQSDESGPFSGWLVDEVAVTDLLSQRSFVFHPHLWIGVSDIGAFSGSPDVVVPLTSHDGAALFAHLAKATSVRVSQSNIAESSKKKRARTGVRRGVAGEDAYVVSPQVLGVADGVFSWVHSGVDSSLFSTAILDGVVDALKNSDSLGDALSVSFAQVVRDSIKGSATVCLCQFIRNAQNKIVACEVLNLGDSGLLLVRGGERIVFRTDELEHDFGYPLQLGHHEASDSVSDADVERIDVYADDVLILATDGLFDNVTDEEILAETSTWLKTPNSPERDLANALVRRAFGASQDPKATTPYSLAASHVFDLAFSGGKTDDITVIVARFCE